MDKQRAAGMHFGLKWTVSGDFPLYVQGVFIYCHAFPNRLVGFNLSKYFWKSTKFFLVKLLHQTNAPNLPGPKNQDNLKIFHLENHGSKCELCVIKMRLRGTLKRTLHKKHISLLVFTNFFNYVMKTATTSSTNYVFHKNVSMNQKILLIWTGRSVQISTGSHQNYDICGNVKCKNVSKMGL